MQLQGPRRRGRRGYRMMTEINVTPFIDVMLVLLIVFMVTAPLIIAGTPIDLPANSTAAAMPDDRTLIVRVAANGDIQLGRQSTPVKPEVLVSEVMRLVGGDREKPVVVIGERQASYGQVAAVLGPLSAAGFTGLALGKMEPAAPAPAPAKSGKKT
ncbi:MAG: biopolymer transporter ExbD [Alphaproteobacteria bacterium]|nr:biopolymer transporter ExbD [Alphaproteobacteria bacterium]